MLVFQLILLHFNFCKVVISQDSYSQMGHLLLRWEDNIGDGLWPEPLVESSSKLFALPINSGMSDWAFYWWHYLLISSCEDKHISVNMNYIHFCICIALHENFWGYCLKLGKLLTDMSTCVNMRTWVWITSNHIRYKARCGYEYL